MVFGATIAGADYNRMYGFYHPEVPDVPHSITVEHRLASHLQRPLGTPQDALEVFRGLGDVSPTIQRFTSLLETGATHIHLHDSPHSVFARERQLGLPKGRAVIHYFVPLLLYMGMLTPLEGVEMSEALYHPNVDMVVERIWLMNGWKNALGASFVFQVAHELDAFTNLKPFVLGRERGWLTRTELAFFRIFREKGLRGVAKELRRFHNKDKLSTIDGQLRSEAQEIVMAGGETQAWALPAVSERPILQASSIDRLADRLAPFESGLLMKTSRTPLSSKRLTEVHQVLATKFFELSKLNQVMALIGDIHPDLWARLKAPWEKGQVKIRLTSESLRNPALAIMDIQDGSCHEWLVARGISGRDFILFAVGELAKLALPSELKPNRTWEPLTPCEKNYGEVREYFLELSRVLECWGYTARLAWQQKAQACGISVFPLTDMQRKVLETLQSVGFGVLMDRWYQHLPPGAVQEFETNAGIMATAVIGSHRSTSPYRKN